MPAPFDQLLQSTHRFFYNLDEFRYDEMASAFAEDGVWHRMGKALKGHAPILGNLQERSRTQHTRHVVSNAFLSESDDDSATLIAYVTTYRYEDGTTATKPPFKASGPLNLLPIKIRFRREGGRWLMAEHWGAPEFDFSK